MSVTPLIGGFQVGETGSVNRFIWFLELACTWFSPGLVSEYWGESTPFVVCVHRGRSQSVQPRNQCPSWTVRCFSRRCHGTKWQLWEIKKARVLKIISSSLRWKFQVLNCVNMVLKCSFPFQLYQRKGFKVDWKNCTVQVTTLLLIVRNNLNITKQPLQLSLF